MPSDYATRGLLAESPVLLRRTRMAVLKKAGQVIASADPDASEERLARDILTNADSWTKRFTELSASFGTLTSDDLTDGALDTIVSTAFAKLAPKIFPPA